MSRLQFVGSVAGLIGDAERAKLERPRGDANSAFDYLVICTCKVDLGPLGRFIPNQDGFRTVLCPKCRHVTIVDKDGQIQAYVPFDPSKK